MLGSKPEVSRTTEVSALAADDDVTEPVDFLRVFKSEKESSITFGVEVAAAVPVVPRVTRFLTRARAGCGNIHVRSRPAVTIFQALQYCPNQVKIPAIKP